MFNFYRVYLAVLYPLFVTVAHYFNNHHRLMTESNPQRAHMNPRGKKIN